MIPFKGFLPRVFCKSVNTKFIKQIIVDKYSLKKLYSDKILSERNQAKKEQDQIKVHAETY